MAASTITDSPKNPPKLKKTRCTSVARHHIQNNRLKMEVHRKRDHKKATIHYKVEKDKVHGISAKKVSELVKKSHGIIISAKQFNAQLQKVRHACC